MMNGVDPDYNPDSVDDKTSSVSPKMYFYIVHLKSVDKHLVR